uniref:Uncharacterized protein n=1 Tax=Pygocentrus nattereri TaxID=42514 RepID=A0A3B4D2W0_PYGNA
MGSTLKIVPDFSGLPPSTAVRINRNALRFSRSRGLFKTRSGSLVPSLFMSTFKTKQSLGLRM